MTRRRFVSIHLFCFLLVIHKVERALSLSLSVREQTSLKGEKKLYVFSVTQIIGKIYKKFGTCKNENPKDEQTRVSRYTRFPKSSTVLGDSLDALVEVKRESSRDSKTKRTLRKKNRRDNSGISYVESSKTIGRHTGVSPATLASIPIDWSVEESADACVSHRRAAEHRPRQQSATHVCELHRHREPQADGKLSGRKTDSFLWIYQNREQFAICNLQFATAASRKLSQGQRGAHQVAVAALGMKVLYCNAQSSKFSPGSLTI